MVTYKTYPKATDVLSPFTHCRVRPPRSISTLAGRLWRHLPLPPGGECISRTDKCLQRNYQVSFQDHLSQKWLRDKQGLEGGDCFSCRSILMGTVWYSQSQPCTLGTGPQRPCSRSRTVRLCTRSATYPLASFVFEEENLRTTR